MCKLYKGSIEKGIHVITNRHHIIPAKSSSPLSSLPHRLHHHLRFLYYPPNNEGEAVFVTFFANIFFLFSFSAVSLWYTARSLLHWAARVWHPVICKSFTKQQRILHQRTRERSSFTYDSKRRNLAPAVRFGLNLSREGEHHLLVTIIVDIIVVHGNKKKPKEMKDAAATSSSSYDGLANHGGKHAGTTRGREEGHPAPPSFSLFVQGLPLVLDSQGLRAFFSQFGDVLPSTRVFRDRGYGFVDFASRQSMEAALAAGASSLCIDGLRIKMERAREDGTEHSSLELSSGSERASVTTLSSSDVEPSSSPISKTSSIGSRSGAGGGSGVYSSSSSYNSSGMTTSTRASPSRRIVSPTASPVSSDRARSLSSRTPGMDDESRRPAKHHFPLSFASVLTSNRGGGETIMEKSVSESNPVKKNNVVQESLSSSQLGAEPSNRSIKESSAVAEATPEAAQNETSSRQESSKEERLTPSDLSKGTAETTGMVPKHIITPKKLSPKSEEGSATTQQSATTLTTNNIDLLSPTTFDVSRESFATKDSTNDGAKMTTPRGSGLTVFPDFGTVSFTSHPPKPSSSVSSSPSSSSLRRMDSNNSEIRTYCVQVFNLPWMSGIRDVAHVFSMFGPVHSIRMIEADEEDRLDLSSSGRDYRWRLHVRFASETDVMRAMEGCGAKDLPVTRRVAYGKSLVLIGLYDSRPDFVEALEMASSLGIVESMDVVATRKGCVVEFLDPGAVVAASTTPVFFDTNALEVTMLVQDGDNASELFAAMATVANDPVGGEEISPTMPQPLMDQQTTETVCH